MHTKIKKTKSFYDKESKQKRFCANKNIRFCRFAETYQATCLIGSKHFKINKEKSYLQKVFHRKAAFEKYILVLRFLIETIFQKTL